MHPSARRIRGLGGSRANFGSRANWTTKDSSDLDLAVEGVASLDHGVMVGLEIAFEESNLPYTVDVVDLNAVSPGFKRIVEDQRVLLPSMATSHLPDKKIVAGRHDTTQGWHQVNLGDIAEIFDGPHATPKKTEDGPVFLGISNLVNGRIDISTAEHLSDSDYATWTKRVIPQPGDIVFSYETRLGEAAAIPPGLQCCLGRRMGLLRVSKELVDPQFLLYAYLGPEFQGTLQSRTVQGSTVDRILLTELGTFPIRIPLLPEQRAIAHVLGTLDDKIELNRQINQTLEEMARAIYKDWFVDFGPTRAKLEGLDPYLPQDLWDLFPEQMVGSELGEIPEGWEVGELGEIIEILDRIRIPLNSRQRSQRQGPYPYYGAAGIMDYVDDFLFDGVFVLTGEDGSVIDNDGCPVVQYVWGQFWVNNHAHVMKGKNGVSDEYLYLLLKGQNIGAFVTGAVQPKLSQGNLKAVPIVKPDLTIYQTFTALTGPIFSSFRHHSDESHTLSAQRDTLLPKLVSGEISVATR